jgi:pimeloyl-ACP methyl ester carboxylesterase
VIGVVPKTRYARNGDVAIAYQLFGHGEVDLLLLPGFVSHVEFCWQEPSMQRWLEGLASFSRVVMLDHRGWGLSDPGTGAATLEERVDDVCTVLDTVGSRQAALLGISEGGAVATVFAAQYPERTRALVLYGAAARLMAGQDYPWGLDEATFRQLFDDFADLWGEGTALPRLAPSRVDDARFAAWWAALERMGASPGRARRTFEMFTHIDIRDVLASVHVPTLVLHRRGDRMVPVEAGEYLAEHIAGSRLVELDGADHLPYAGDTGRLLAEIEEFLTGSRLPYHGGEDRVLAIVLFVDVAGSTAFIARVGDAVWAATRARFLTAVRRQVDRYEGTEVDVAGDGMLATFTGPARAIRCAVAIRDDVLAEGLQVRAGVHAGEVERDGQGGVSGLALHIGARVMAEAAPDEVLVSGTVKDLVVGSGLEFTGRGTRELRGVPGTWPLFAVVG